MLADLKRERMALHRAQRPILEALALAIAQKLPTEEDLRETMHANYARLAALDMAIASYDPQQGLFLDL